MPSARAALHAILAYSRRSRVLITTLTLTLGMGAGFVPAAPADPSANVTKAEMLWNVAKFIQWPDSPAPQARGQLVFTILGEDDLAAELANLLSTRTINGKPIFVRFARRAQDAHGSQMLYIAGSETAHLDEVLHAVADAPMLTVADTPGFAARGGMVGFANDGGRARFEVNLGHAEHNGLRISAKLLALARVIDTATAEAR